MPAADRHAARDVWLEHVVDHRQRGGDGHVHVEVLVGAEPTTEDDVGLGVGKGAVTVESLPVSGGVDRGVGVVRRGRRAGGLPCDDGAGGGGGGLGGGGAKL